MVSVWGSIFSWHSPLYLKGSIPKYILWGFTSKLFHLQFHFPFLEGSLDNRYHEHLKKKKSYFPVHIRGWIPGAALFLLSPCVHSGVVALVSSFFPLSTSVQETSVGAVTLAPRAEATYERTKYSWSRQAPGARPGALSSALRCVEQPDQCRSISSSQGKHICHVPSITPSFSILI